MKAAHALALASVFFTSLAAAEARADPPAPGATGTPSTLSLRAAPVFGTDAACGEGWAELVATVDNPGSGAVKGTLEIESACLPMELPRATGTYARV